MATAVGRRGLFSRRRRCPNSYDYTAALQSCPNVSTLKLLHAQIIAGGLAGNPFVAAKLVSLYADLSSFGMDDARRAFLASDTRDVLLWNVLIRGYAAGDSPEEALAAYKLMRGGGGAANRYTYPFLLKACVDLKSGAAVHAEVWKVGFPADLYVGNALVSLYARGGEFGGARRMFDEMPERDVVTWNSLVAGLARGEMYGEAVEVLRRMAGGRERPDRITLVAALPACGKAAAAREGLWAHGYAVKEGMRIDAALGAGLVGMYASCGRLEYARKVFEGMEERNVVVWGAMMKGVAEHGMAREAAGMMEEMRREGVEPDGVCYLSLMSAYAHGGMAEEGIKVFEGMEAAGVERREEHYGCAADLLGRAGRLREAAEMAAAGGREGWGAVLRACRIYGEGEVGRVAAERVVEMEGWDGGRYVAAVGLFEGEGRREEAARVRVMMRERGARKVAGWSAVELEGRLHGFGVRDESHARTEDIYGAVHGMARIMMDDDDDDHDLDG